MALSFTDIGNKGGEKIKVALHLCFILKCLSYKNIIYIKWKTKNKNKTSTINQHFLKMISFEYFLKMGIYLVVLKAIFFWERGFSRGIQNWEELKILVDLASFCKSGNAC